MPFRLRRLVATSALLATAAAPLALTATSNAADDDRVAPVLGLDAGARIDGEYIVVLRDTTSRLTARATRT